MIFQKDCLLRFEKIQYLFSRQGGAVDAGGVCGFERLHEGDLFFYALFADIAVLLGVESAFIVQQFNVRLNSHTFGVLFVPFFGSSEEQVKVKMVYLFCIFKMGFKTFDEVVPEQEFVFIKEPGET